MPHHLLFYEAAPDYESRRAAHRAEHLQLARAAVARGELVLGGALADPLDGAVLLFSAGREVAEAFARADPYVREGLVASWRVRTWTTVVGPDAAGRVDDFAAPPGPGDEGHHAKLVAFLRSARHWVVSSLAEDGSPRSAVVGVAVGDAGQLVFDTLGTSRKAAALRRDPRVSLVMWCGAATAQIEGRAEEPAGEAREAAKRVYFATFPDGVERAASPDITWFRVTPSWIRVTDFGGDAPREVEIDPRPLSP